MKTLPQERIKEICDLLGIKHTSDNIPTIDEIKDKFRKCILSDTTAHLLDYEYSFMEDVFIIGIIYGVNYTLDWEKLRGQGLDNPLKL